jgi:transcription initiation factor TFIIE subunit alpha
MADLATSLLRTTARAFYPTEHILVIDALILHSTLSDTDLAYALGMNNNTKALRKLCGRLKEDGLISVQTRAERRTDGTQSFFPGGSQQGKERVTHKDWYYLNFHRAIDSIKYRMYRLNKHVESLGAPTTEKKDRVCPRCGSQYTDLEALDHLDPTTGTFLCGRCGNPLDEIEEEERANENESMKRLNSQLEKILRLMQQIDATTVPENDFQTALSKQKPVLRNDANPGQQRMEIVDLPNKNLASTKGLEIKPERIAVQVQDDEVVKQETEAAEAAAKREKEARQNMLPDWIAKSTVSGDITAVGAKEELLRREREVHTIHATNAADTEQESNKPAKDDGEDALAEYFKQMEKLRAEEAAERAQEAEDEAEEEDDEDEGEFEDVDVSGSGANGKPARNGNGVNGIKGSAVSSGVGTPNLESSNATDDEREVKRVRVEAPANATGGPAHAVPAASLNGRSREKAPEGTPAASDEDEDDELEFENVG